MQTASASKCTHQAKSLDKFGGSPCQPSLLAQMVKRLPAMPETQVQSLVLGRSPGEGNGNPLQYPCLENLIDRGAW